MRQPLFATFFIERRPAGTSATVANLGQGYATTIHGLVEFLLLMILDLATPSLTRD